MNTKIFSIILGTMLATVSVMGTTYSASIPSVLHTQKTLADANPAMYIPSLQNVNLATVQGSTLSSLQLADAGFVLAMYRDYARIHTLFADYITVHGERNFKQAMKIFENKVDQGEKRYGEYYQFATSVFGYISDAILDDLFDDDIIEDDADYYVIPAKNIPAHTSVHPHTTTAPTAPTHNAYYFDGDADEQAIYAWAKSKNLTTTNSLQSFNPDGWVTRDEVAVVIERAFNNNIFSARQKGRVSAYRDAKMISPEFPSAIYSLQAMGIMKGDARGNFRPKGYITELEAIILLSRAAGASVTLSDVQYLEYARNTLGIMADWDDVHDRLDREEFFELIQAVAFRLGR